MAQATVDNDGLIENYIAVGTFEPVIEIWNADILDVLGPTLTPPIGLF